MYELIWLYSSLTMSRNKWITWVISLIHNYWISAAILHIAVDCTWLVVKIAGLFYSWLFCSGAPLGMEVVGWAESILWTASTGVCLSTADMTVFSVIMSSACTCLKNEKFHMFWWPSCSPYWLLCMDSDQRAERSYCT